LRRWLLALAALLIVTLALTVRAAPVADLRKGPYLVYRNDPTKMTVVWQTKGTARKSLVQWGLGRRFTKSSGALKRSKDDLYEHEITGLRPGKPYSYRVIVDGRGQAGAFLAAPKPSVKRLTIYAYGDTRSHPDVHDSVCAAMLKDIAASPGARQTASLHTGDWVGNGDEEDDWDEQYFDRKQPNALSLMSKLPILGCRGNHEKSAALLRKYWPYSYESPPGCYYSFDYGPLHVTVIDQYTDYSPGSVQRTWLEKDLADTDRTWKIVLWHQPAWSAGGHGDDKEARKLQPLFKKMGVHLTLAGHNHYYARCDVDGLQHVTIGGGGAPLYTPKAKGGKLVLSRKVHHFMRLDMTERKLTATVMDTRGRKIDIFSVPAKTPVTNSR
jgi:hypothetical protein